MGKDIDILKVITHADGGEEYARNATKYPANEYCVGLKGYGVDCNDPDTAKMQFESVAKFHGNEGKNQFVHFMMSFLKKTAPDSKTSMSITDQVLEPLKDEYQILIGNHQKHRGSSDFHTHGFVGTTNLETGKMLHANNKLNYAIAQRMADVIQKPVELVIEKKKPGQNASHDTDDVKKNDDFTRVFYPHKAK
ncbi:MAG: relaxase/mobilization nuclease domain-containing protein [Ruminococcus sp.]|nr:relaxase/mobilization nuclease domain-containing protein [Ruminococcus sp.]